MSLFDLLQLSFLLYLMAINNPFAMLMLGPVIISATVMSLRSTLMVGAAASFWFRCWQFTSCRCGQSRVLFCIPDVFLFGHWAALVIAVAFMSLYAIRVTTEIRSMAQARRPRKWPCPANRS